MSLCLSFKILFQNNVNMKIYFRIFLLWLIFCPLALNAQKYTISGIVKDKNTGESLIGVNVYVKNTTTGVITNPYGFFSISLPQGEYLISANYLGFADIDTLINLDSNIKLNFEMAESAMQLEEVKITGKRTNDDISSTRMSMVTLSSKTIKQVPVAFGEVDLIKTLSFLPGVKTTDEGSSLSVRGGARDQNLILLDEATVYNASHLGNLFSIFNNDAVQNVEFFKGNMPAQYGGRLSSVIDIRMKEGNNKKYAASGGIGTMSSRLNIEGPIVKNKGSFIISARRAYIDILTKAIKKVIDTFPEVPYYFYDLNLKTNFTINEKNRIFASGYFGKDVFKMESEGNDFNTKFSWGNYTGTLRWNFLPSDKIFTNLTLLVSNYGYNMGSSYTYGKDRKESRFDWDASLLDYSLKYDVGIYLNENVTLKTGFISTYHDFNPGKIEGKDDTITYNFKMATNNALEHGIYLGSEHKITPKLMLGYGIRYSLFQNIGKATVYQLDNEYLTTDTLFYKKGDIFNFYQGFEPRLALTYMLSEKSSIKAGYNRTSQYVHIASNSTSSTVIDIWVGSGENIKPQVADLYSAGYFRNFMDKKIETSVEIYYKDMQNQIEFREFATPQFNPRMDEDFRFGKGRSYGIEFLARKNEGRLTGWIGYTYSKTELKINDIQEKGWFTSTFDRTHDLTIVGSYDVKKWLSISANFLLKSGRPFTTPVLRYEYDGAVIPYYTKRNNDRMPLYHRLDIAATFKWSGRKFHNEIVFSIFDLYNRVNPISIYFRPDEDNENITKAYKQNFLGFMPSITWNFNF